MVYKGGEDAAKRLEAMHLIVLEITLLIIENHGIVLNFCGNPVISTVSQLAFLMIRKTWNSI